MGVLRVLAVVGWVTALAMSTGCTSSGSSGEPVAPHLPPQTKPTQENYLSGDAFCALYQKITGQEVGIHVTVPKDYEHPERGTLSIYAYTNQTFDPAKASYLYVDGGPGQNSHGLTPDYLKGAVNEIRFDQRGLGCSAPPTWTEYADAHLYSSLNNVRDMDEIRKAYGIQKWSIYGVSYGTVPATMYGSKFAQQTTSVVLEGVVGDFSLLHDPQYKVDKLNLVYQSLSLAQRGGLAKLLTEVKENGESTDDSHLFWTYMQRFFYSDKGMSSFAERINLYVDSQGTIQREALARLRSRWAKQAAQFPRPQQPGAVDDNMFVFIACRDLGWRHRSSKYVEFGSDWGFYVATSSRARSAAECDEAHVSDETPYQPMAYPISAPVYYFQGAHDGATLASGAVKHWQVVPQGKSYFLLAEKGGHNPNLTRLESDDSRVADMERGLFGQAIAGSEITATELAADNLTETPDQHWKLYLAPDDPGLTADQQGMSLQN